MGDISFMQPVGETSLSSTSTFELEVAALIVETLNLEVDPAQIEALEPLFGEGLGLDSIDALELSLGIFQKYGYRLKADDPQNAEIFSSLRSLAAFIEQNRSQ